MAPKRAAAPVSIFGVVLELQGLEKTPDLNGKRGICLGQTAEQACVGRIGIRLDDNRELSVRHASTSSLFDVEEAAGRGVGAVARKKLVPGDLLVRERPVLFGRLGERPTASDMDALAAAPRAADVWALSDLYAAGPDEPKTLEGIFCTNALPQGPQTEDAVLCPATARFNHSCAPNCEYLWIDAIGENEVRVVQNVEPGEELSVNYLGDAIRLPAVERRRAIYEAFRFKCCCRACTKPDAEEAAASDKRRARIAAIDREILDCRERPEEGVRLAEESLRLLSQEGLSAPRTVAQICNDGYELSVLAGDRSEAQVWAHMSYEAHRLGWGENYPMTQLMKTYAQNPQTLEESETQIDQECAPEVAGEEDNVPVQVSAQEPGEDWLTSLD